MPKPEVNPSSGTGEEVTDLQDRVKPTLVEMAHYVCTNVVHGWSKTLT